MVAVSPHPNSHYLIRSTRRWAFRLDSPWLAVYVDNGAYLDEEEKAMLAKNLALARNFGAEVITVIDPDITGRFRKDRQVQKSNSNCCRKVSKTLDMGIFQGAL